MELFYKHYPCKGFGSGEPLIILHGLFGNQANWTLHAKYFSEKFEVYALDVRNHGRSEWDDSMSYPEMAQDIVQTMDALGLDSANFIAHSMGGKIAMQLAMLAPQRINKLIIVDIAPVDYPTESHVALDALETIDLSSIQSRSQVDDLLSKSVREKGVRDFLLTNLQRNKNKSYSWRFNLEALLKNFLRIKGGLDSIGVYEKGILFIKGSASDYILPQYEAETLSLFPKAKVKIIQNAGHWVHSEKPSAFIKISEDYLLS